MEEVKAGPKIQAAGEENNNNKMCTHRVTKTKTKNSDTKQNLTRQDMKYLLRQSKPDTTEGRQGLFIKEGMKTHVRTIKGRTHNNETQVKHMGKKSRKI